MENALKHPGFAARFVLDVFLVTQAAAALLCVLWNGRGVFRATILVCEAVSTLFGVLSLFLVVTAAHFEGYILIVALALILQGVFTAVTLLKRTPSPAA